MTISEMIAKLKKAKRLHGELDVKITVRANLLFDPIFDNCETEEEFDIEDGNLLI
jgi:hypothetical protein